ncbi:MAG: type III pantothenate kinase [Geodermatophilaceae bacterium]
MLLAIDVGNTQTVLGLFDGAEIVDSWRVSTDPRATSDELALTICGLLDQKCVTGVVACSTVPPIRREIALAAGPALRPSADDRDRARSTDRRAAACRQPARGGS